MIKIVFVCTGNICRSAMAEAYMKYLLKKNNSEEKILVCSAGIDADEGSAATEYAITAIAQYGANLKGHIARSIYSLDLSNFDEVIVMTAEHKRRLCEIFPEITSKVKLLKEYMKTKGSEYMNIDDPWGLSYNVYKNCALEIVNCVDNLVKELLEEGD